MTLTPDQSRMARAGLKWTLDDLAAATGLGRATIARFELGQAVNPESIAAIREAFESKRVTFVDSGKLRGGVVLGLRRGG